MRKGLMLAAASVLVLSACSPAESAREESYREQAAADTAADTAAGTVRAVAARTPEPEAPVAPPAPIAKIAYAFSYIMSVPKDRGAELMSRHELACASAGAGYCQVVSARADWTSREPGGRLELRGQPDWINRFRSQLALDAQNAGGRLDAAVTNGEDVTRGIDTAATGAKTTASLADRIRDLQARRGGTLEQRLQVERQLADLQRQYDAQQLALRALNDRVQSARLTLEYRQGGVMAADSPTRPVARALADAFGLSMGMLALLITAGSVLLPIAVIGGAVWWAVVRRRKPAAA
ncbi:MAG: DUF4349 domain-containing protein [Caulobacterales bacterium]|nr:DUF4349 domain-containing protein [Caulobacterales bacterium]